MISPLAGIAGSIWLAEEKKGASCCVCCPFCEMRIIILMMSLLRALDELKPGKAQTLVHRWALSKCWLLCCDCLDSQQEEKRLWAHGGWDWAARSWMGSCTRYGSWRIRYRAWVKLQAMLLVYLGRREHDVTLYFTRKRGCSMRKEGRKGGLTAWRLGLKWQGLFGAFSKCQLTLHTDPGCLSLTPAFFYF